MLFRWLGKLRSQGRWQHLHLLVKHRDGSSQTVLCAGLRLHVLLHQSHLLLEANDLVYALSQLDTCWTFYTYLQAAAGGVKSLLQYLSSKQSNGTVHTRSATSLATACIIVCKAAILKLMSWLPASSSTARGSATCAPPNRAISGCHWPSFSERYYRSLSNSLVCSKLQHAAGKLGPNLHGGEGLNSQ